MFILLIFLTMFSSICSADISIPDVQAVSTRTITVLNEGNNTYVVDSYSLVGTNGEPIPWYEERFTRDEINRHLVINNSQLTRLRNPQQYIDAIEAENATRWNRYLEVLDGGR